ncbi:MAG TPA: TonB-dependent siderophore receptor [Thermoanaerobaculia bacterium]|nr:TonB-dependent siderophore receptor [Thermoanaerobaculia bacterium]
MFSESTIAAGAALLAAWMGAQPPASPPDEGKEPTAAQESPRPALTERDTIYVRDTAEKIAVDASIATKLSVPLERTPFSVGVVTAGVIEEQDARTLSEAVLNVSGVTVQPQTGVHDLVLFRGLDSLNSGLILVDGAPEPEASYYQLYNVERVEVLKGPAGFLYGANPLGGAINLVRAHADRPWVHQHRATAGSFDTLRYEVDVNTRGQERGVAFRFNGLYAESGGYRDRQDSKVVGINPTATWWLSEESSLRLNAEWLGSDSTPDAGLPIVAGEVLDVPRRRSYGSPFDFSEQEILRLRADWEAALGGRWRLRDKLYFNQLDWQTSGTLPFAVVPLPPSFSPAVLRALTSLDDEQDFLGNQLEATRAGERHTLLLGLELQDKTDAFTITNALLQPIDVEVPLESPVPPFPLPQFDELGDATIRLVSPYLLERLTFGDRFELFVGARYDMLEFEDPTKNRDLEEEQLSPSLGLLYAAGPVSLYASYSEGFSPPSTRTVGDLKPEESQQVELGVKFQLANAKVSGSAAVYDLTRDNLAIFDGGGFTAQIGAQESQGFELDLVAVPADGWRVQAAYGYTDAVLDRFNERVDLFPSGFELIDRSGNRPAFAPEHVINLWLHRQLRSGLGFGVGGRYVADQFIAEANQFAIDSSTVFDAMASYAFRRVRLSLNAKNLTDEEYLRRGFGTASVIPGDGRNYTLGVEFRP